MQRYKIILGGLFVVLLLFVTPLQGQAASTYEIDVIFQPQFENLSGFQNLFSISETGIANMSTVIIGYDVNAIYLFTYLQQYKNGSWQTIASWNGNSEKSLLTWTKTYNVVKGYSYRFKSDVSLYKNGTFLESTSYVSESTWY